MSGLKIIEKSQTKFGTDIQLEAWGWGDNTEYAIGAYPIAKYGGYWVRPGERFRLHLSRFKTNDDCEKTYEDLKSGAITLADLTDHYWNGEKDMYYMGLVPQMASPQ